MPESRDAFIAQVKRLEQISKQEPSAYRVRLGALALLGYAYIIGLLLVLLGLMAGIVAFNIITGHFYAAEIKLLLFLGIVVFIILRSLWVKVPLPQGIPLQRSDVPELFALIDSLSRELNVPRLDRVLLTGEFNAAAAQFPRLGVFGWYANYLILGYPLMQSVSPEQFRAILAHELGHLSRHHGRFGVWIWRLRETWGRLAQGSDGKRHGFLFDVFLKWYGPKFMAYSFVLARADEYEADRYAVRLTNARVMAEGLVSTRIRDTFLDKAFWEPLTREVRVSPAPPSQPFTRLGETLRQPMLTEDTHKWLSMALSQQTDYDDTHPALRERVAALGFPEVLEQPDTIKRFLSHSLSRSAAEEYLGIAHDRLLEMLNHEWVTRTTPIWQKQHKQAQEGQARLDELEAQIEQGETLSTELRWEHARLMGELHSSSVAKPLIEALHADCPEFTPAIYALGHILLEEEDERGIAYIQQAMSADADFVLPGCQTIYGYLKARGRDAEAEPFLNQGLQQVELLQEADVEMARITKTDHLVASELPAEVQQHITEVVAQHHEIASAYLVRKIIPQQPTRVCHLLTVKLKFKGIVLSEQEAITKVVNALVGSLNVKHEILIVAIHGSTNKFLEAKLRPIPGAQIYQKSKA